MPWKVKIFLKISKVFLIPTDNINISKILNPLQGGRLQKRFDIIKIFFIKEDKK
jgi:hypothetical protein